MLKLDNNLLQELGLGSLPEDQKKAMLQHIYETLELRVGTNLANQMTDQQLEEFEKFIDDGGDANQAQALQWLEANLPNYKQVVNEVFEQLKSEIKQMSAQIMATSQPTQPAVVPVAPEQPQAQAPAAYHQPAQPQYQQPRPAPQSPPTQGYQPAPQGYQPAPQDFQPSPQSNQPPQPQ